MPVVRPHPGATRDRRLLSAGLALAGLLGLPSVVLAQFAPPPGVALNQFSVLGHSAVNGSTGAGTLVNGDVGSFPTDTVNNFPPSSVAPGFFVRRVATGDGPLLIQARIDATAAFVALSQAPATTLPADLSQANGTGIVTSGIYNFLGGAALLPAGQTLTLNGPGIFIFQTQSTLTTVAGSNVTGTANPCNVYWQIGSSATVDSQNFFGQIFARASITLTGNLIGKTVAGASGATGAVTFPVGGNIVGGCAVAGGPGPGPGPVPALTDIAMWGLVTILLAGGVFVLGRR